MIKVEKYTCDLENMWNSFNAKSKNSLFMFDRKYMDYHSDRFTDNSLMFYEDDKLVAILPANLKENTLYSHGGLTFGGFITDEKMKQNTMMECFEELNNYAKRNRIQKIIYKSIPQIYCSQSAEEAEFAMFAYGASLSAIDVSTYINLESPLKMPKGRKAQISRAKREGVFVEELDSSEAFELFIQMENDVLRERHDVKAAHTGAELKMLHDRFPNNIHLFAATRDGRMIAGTIIYEYERVIHTQYMMTNDEARQIGALDLTISTVIDKYKNTKRWLDFGISTEHGKIYLNKGLCSQKEGFGGRTGVYRIWEMSF